MEYKDEIIYTSFVFSIEFDINKNPIYIQANAKLV